MLKSFLKILLFLNIFFGSEIYAQSGLKIEFKDYHSTDLSDLQLTQDKKYILTSDGDGKVLMYDAADFEFVKTVKPFGKSAVSGMRTIKNDSLLMISQSNYLFLQPELDTLVIKMLYSESEPLSKKQLSFQFLDTGSDENFGVLSAEQSVFSFALFDRNLKQKFAVSNLGILAPEIIAVSSDMEKFAYVPRDSKNKIIILNTQTGQPIQTLEAAVDKEVVSIFFDKINHALFALTSEKDSSELKIYSLDSDSFEKPVFSLDYPVSSFDKIITRYDGDQQIIAVINRLPRKPLVIFRNGHKFSHHIVDIINGASKALIDTSRKQILFANQMMSKTIQDFSVFDYSSKKITGKFPETSGEFYLCSFLPDNSWIVYQPYMYGGDILNQNIKYFEAGTFNNRFSKFSFRDYLQLHHNIYPYYAKLDRNEGAAIIYGGKENSSYYRYDFASDKLTKLTEGHLNFTRFQDYNSAKNILLLGSDFYVNRGHTESTKFELVKEGKIIPLDGDYKFGRFSGDGNYLATISKENLFEIRTTDHLKKVFSRQLKEGSYHLFGGDESDFAVSNEFRFLDMNKCNMESFSWEMKNGESKVYEAPCVVFNDIDYVNGKTGGIVENIGLVIGKNALQFPKSHFPEAFSFNSDGSRFMVSFSDGKTAVYDTETLQPLGVMMHPDIGTHVFYDVQNHFFSNISPEQYLVATENGKKIPIQHTEPAFFKPEKILNIFGTPDENYLAALNKALQLRKKNASTETDIAYTKKKTASSGKSQENKTVKTNSGSSKPNLYLLSIGISDYKDTSYNLTFSDKDAMDMARIYGKLGQEQLNAYKDKFFGTTYKVYNQQHELVSSMSHYGGAYEINGSKYLLNTKGTIWLEDQLKEFALWNFEDSTVKKIELPDSEYLGIFPNFGERIFIKPDQDGFYWKGKTGFYEYSFSTGKFSEVSLPFQPERNNFIPLKNNRWLHFDDQHTVLNINTGKFHDSKFEKKQEIRFGDYDTRIRDIREDGSLATDSIWLYNKYFMGASEDGRYVFFSSGSDLLYVDLNEKDIIPVRLPVSFENRYAVQLSVNAGQKEFYLLEEFLDSDTETDTKKLTACSFNGKKLRTLTFDKNFQQDGVVNNGTDYFYIKAQEGLLSKNELMNADETLEKTTPYTFENVYIEYLTNQKADSKAVKQQLQTFFSKASPNDQIMVFLAGHGVLDEQKNYYFAPYDMDFKKVSRNGISFETIIQSMQKSQASGKLLLMDTCHSGKTVDMEGAQITSGTTAMHSSGKRGAVAISLDPPQYKVSDVISTLFEDFLSKSGITIISASSGGNLAQEHKDWGNGALTSSYIRLLKSKMKGSLSERYLDEEDTRIPIKLDDDFINQLYRDVIELTDGKQVPDLRELNKDADISVW